MAATAFIGYLLLAGGPPLVIWCSFIANKSFLVLLALASAFYWLLNLIIVSLLFRAFVPLPEYAAVFGVALVIATVLQEGARYGAYAIHRTIVNQLGHASHHMSLPKPTGTDERLMALSHGMGHAVAQTGFLYFSWIQLAAGKGTLYLDACPQMPYFLAAGLLSLGFFFMHSFSMVTAFHGYNRRNVAVIGIVSIQHLVTALMTLMSLRHGGCVAATSFALLQGCAAVIQAAYICWKWATEDNSRPQEGMQLREDNSL